MPCWDDLEQSDTTSSDAEVDESPDESPHESAQRSTRVTLTVNDSTRDSNRLSIRGIPNQAIMKADNSNTNSSTLKADSLDRDRSTLKADDSIRDRSTLKAERHKQVTDAELERHVYKWSADPSISSKKVCLLFNAVIQFWTECCFRTMMIIVAFS